jgi:hypothetical protein
VAYSDLRNKLETAAAALVTALGVSGLSVYTGADEDDQALPKAVCIAEDFTEAFPESGNYYASLRVRVASNADDTDLSAHNAIAAAVFDELLMDDLPSALSAAGNDFTVHGVRNTELETQREGRTWVDIVRVNLMCCSKDV